MYPSVPPRSSFLPSCLYILSTSSDSFSSYSAISPTSSAPTSFFLLLRGLLFLMYFLFLSVILFLYVIFCFIVSSLSSGSSSCSTFSYSPHAVFLRSFFSSSPVCFLFLSHVGCSSSSFPDYTFLIYMLFTFPYPHIFPSFSIVDQCTMSKRGGE